MSLSSQGSEALVQLVSWLVYVERLYNSSFSVLVASPHRAERSSNKILEFFSYNFKVGGIIPLQMRHSRNLISVTYVNIESIKMSNLKIYLFSVWRNLKFLLFLLQSQNNQVNKKGSNKLNGAPAGGGWVNQNLPVLDKNFAKVKIWSVLNQEPHKSRDSSFLACR